MEKFNIALREQIKTYIDKDKALPFRFDQLDINALISELDPSIWSFINNITMSTSECRGTSKCIGNSILHVKKVRRFFACL